MDKDPSSTIDPKSTTEIGLQAALQYGAGDICMDRVDDLNDDGDGNGDADSADPKRLLVLERTGKRADDTVVIEHPEGTPDTTVATYRTNERHGFNNPDDETVIAVYIDDIEGLTDESRPDSGELDNVVATYEAPDCTLEETYDARTYPFPEGRLRPIYIRSSKSV